MSLDDMVYVYIGSYEKGPISKSPLEPGVPVKMDPTKLNELANEYTEQLEDLDKLGFYGQMPMSIQEKGFDPIGITLKDDTGMQWHVAKSKFDNHLLGNPEDLKHGIRENTEKKTFEFYVAGYTQLCFGYDVQLCHSLLAYYSDRLKYGWPFTRDSSPDEWFNFSAQKDMQGGIDWTLKTKDEWRDRLYPLASMFKVSLIPELDNPVDPNAIQIWIQPKDEWNSHPDREDIWQRVFGEPSGEHSVIHNRDWQLRAGTHTIIPLGYVPAVLAKILVKQLDRIDYGVVKKIRKTTKKDGTITYSTKVEFSYDNNKSNVVLINPVPDKLKTASQKRIELLEVD
jgi:hypothetical protein